jgi:MFS family permease
MSQNESRRNFRVLIASSGLFGLAFGAYNLALPLFMRASGFSGMEGSVVFAVPLAVGVGLRLWVGRLSDMVGRKLFYVLSMFGAAICGVLTPFFPAVIAQTALKSIRDACISIRDTLHAIFLYESDKTSFIHTIGRTMSVQLIFEAGGLVLVGYGLDWLLPEGKALTARATYGPILLLSGLVLAAAGLLLAVGLRERFRSDEGADTCFLREMFSLKLDPRLYTLMASMFIFAVGLGACHTYIMYVFWQDKFGVSQAGVGWIMAAHRLSFAVPTFFIGSIVRGRVHTHRRLVMIAMIALQAVTIGAAGIIPTFEAALGVWLLHDLVGAGVWSPIRQSLLQRYSRGQKRGSDTTKALALSDFGMVLGALLGGWCYTPQTAAALRRFIPLPGGEQAHLGLPFFAGGVLSLVSIIPLLLLLAMDPEERGEAA